MHFTSQMMKCGRRFDTIVRAVVAVVFLYGALAKWTSAPAPDGASTVFDHMTARWPAASVSVVALEIVLGVWLLSGKRAVGSLLVALAVLSAFTGVLVVETFAQEPASCGCFGNGAASSVFPKWLGTRAWLTIDAVRNVVFVVLLTRAIFKRMTDQSTGGGLLDENERIIE